MRYRIAVPNIFIFLVLAVGCGRMGYADETAVALRSDSEDCTDRVTVCAQSYPEQCRTYCVEPPPDCELEEVCYEAQSYPPRTICHETCASEIVPLDECEEPVIAVSSDGDEIIACPDPDAVPGTPPGSEDGCSELEEVCVMPLIYPPGDPICHEVCVDDDGSSPPSGDSDMSPPGSAGGDSGGSAGSAG
jgi:hypothetical protein